jgi:hypothetical protein
MLIGQLKHLCDKGIVSKKSFPEVPPRVEYTLTPLERELLPVIDQMINWGSIIRFRGTRLFVCRIDDRGHEKEHLLILSIDFFLKSLKFWSEFDGPWLCEGVEKKDRILINNPLKNQIMIITLVFIRDLVINEGITRLYREMMFRRKPASIIIL